MLHPVTLHHSPMISGGWGGPPVQPGFPVWGVLSLCLWSTAYSLAACTSHAAPPARAVALSCCVSEGVRVWGCEGVRVERRREVGPTWSLLKECIAEMISLCALMQLLTSVWTNQRAEFKNSAIWLVDTVIFWNRKLPELGKTTAEVKQKSS